MNNGLFDNFITELKDLHSQGAAIAILMIGIPASGKSSVRRALLKTLASNKELSGQFYVASRDDIVFAYAKALIDYCEEKGVDLNKLMAAPEELRRILEDLDKEEIFERMQNIAQNSDAENAYTEQMKQAYNAIHAVKGETGHDVMQELIIPKFHAWIEYVLAQGKHVIIDATHSNQTDRTASIESATKGADQVGKEVRILGLYCEVGLEEAFRRNSREPDRDKTLDGAVIESKYRELKDNLPQSSEFNQFWIYDQETLKQAP